MNLKFADKNKAAVLISELGEEFAVIKNPDYVFPEFEICPLSQPSELPLKHLKAVVMDMDGTTTTTETLCLHSLEYMVRSITDCRSRQQWTGLDANRDYPHIIGNSTTRHVEYLVRTYQSNIIATELEKAYLFASMWTLTKGRDARRLDEVRNNLHHFGYGLLAADYSSPDPGEKLQFTDAEIITLSAKYLRSDLQRNFNQTVRMAIDIYYQRYHEILAKLDGGNGTQLSEELLGDPDLQLIDPMPGMAIFLTLVKGWLGEDIDQLLPELSAHTRLETDPATLEKMRRLGRRFMQDPLKIAVVTSSIHYEAHIVMKQVFRVLSAQISDWPLSSHKKERLLAYFSDYHNIYDGFITASDSSEIRLKPHRDLYSIALHQLGISKEDFQYVIGFEDSESGTIAIRTAGIGVCIAVPFSETSQHDFSAAAKIVPGGIPEVLLAHNLFLD